MDEIEHSSKEIKKMEAERKDYLQKINDLEGSLERIRSEQDRLISEKQIQLEDFSSQIEASQKQMNQYKRFIEEQTQEREQEREEFNREIQKLKEIFREKERQETKLKEKLQLIEDELNHNYQERQQLQRNYDESLSRLAQANKSVQELQQVLNELERTNEKTTVTERQLNEKINRLENALNTQMKMNEEMKKDHTDQSLFIAHSFIDEMLEKTEQIRCASFDQRLADSPPLKSFSIAGSSVVNGAMTESPSETSSMVECSYADTQLLEQKIKAFYDLIDNLNKQNAKLKAELADTRKVKTDFESRLQELGCEKTKLELDLNEVQKTKEVLQSELNNKHLQLSTLKMRLDENVSNENAQYRQMLEDLKNQLNEEEDRCNKLNTKLAFTTNALEEKEYKLQEMLHKLDSMQTEMASIEGERGALIKSNQELNAQRQSLNQELEQLQRDLEKEKQEHFQDEQQDVVLPQLFKILLKDKEEEIAALNIKLKQFQCRLKELLPESKSEDSMCLLNELQFHLQRYQDRELVQSCSKEAKPIMYNKFVATAPPKSLVTLDKGVNTDPAKTLFNDEDKSVLKNLAVTCKYLQEERSMVLANLGDFVHKLEQQCAQLQAYERDNELLRRELCLRNEKSTFLIRSGTQESANESDDGEEEEEDEENEDDDDEDDENIDESTEPNNKLCLTLADVHNQSMELCKLTKQHRAQSVAVLRKLIAELPKILMTDSEIDGQDDSQWKAKFVNHFPDKELGSLLIEKLGQIRDIHINALNRTRLYSTQLEFANEKLIETEKTAEQYKQRLNNKRNDLVHYENELNKLRKNGELLQRERNMYLHEIANNKEQIAQLAKQITDRSPNEHHRSDLRASTDLYEQLRRCLSHKKALVFQKKYLMNVLQALCQFAGPGDRTYKLLSQLSLLNSSSLTHSFTVSGEKLKVNRFKATACALIAVQRLLKLKRRATPKTDESSIPQFRNQEDDSVFTLYSPLSSMHISKSRSSMHLPTFMNNRNDTYEVTKAPSNKTFLSKSASKNGHHSQQHHSQELHSQKRHSQEHHSQQHHSHQHQTVTKNMLHSVSQSSLPDSFHQTLPHKAVVSNRGDSTKNVTSSKSEEVHQPSLESFYATLKQVHKDIGFDLSTTINSSSNST